MNLDKRRGDVILRSRQGFRPRGHRLDMPLEPFSFLEHVLCGVVEVHLGLVSSCRSRALVRTSMFSYATSPYVLNAVGSESIVWASLDDDCCPLRARLSSRFRLTTVWILLREEEFLERRPSLVRLPSRLAAPAASGSGSWPPRLLLYNRASCFLLIRNAAEYNVRQENAPGFHML